MAKTTKEKRETMKAIKRETDWQDWAGEAQKQEADMVSLSRRPTNSGFQLTI